MTQRKFLLYSFFFSAIQCFADYSDHGRPWDANDNYDSSHGIWFALLILGVIIVVAIYGFAKHTWENHKSEVKDGFGIVAFIGGCILLFVMGKSCSESRPKDNGNAVNVHQIQQQTKQQPTQQYQPQPRQPELRYRTEYYEGTCDRCGGSGIIACSYCNGRGYTSFTCNECNGYGYKEVRKLRYYDPFEESLGGSSNQPEYEKQYCFSCHGEGVIKQACSHCNSQYPMQDLFSGRIVCPTCKGLRTVTKSRQVPYYQN